MIGRRPPGRVGAALTLVLCGALATLARAELPWFEAYERALKAIESRQWSLAEEELKAAMKSGPRPGRRVRAYGVRFIDYIPSYHLTVIYFNQGRHREALEELQRVEASGLISPRDPEFEQMNLIREKAAPRPTAAITPPAPTPAAETAPQTEVQKEAETLVRFARDLVDQGHFAEARKALESARAKDAANPAIAPLGETITRKDAEGRARAEQATTASEVVAKTDFAEGIQELSSLVKRQNWGAARDKAGWLSSRGPRDPELLRLRGLIDKHFAASGPAEQEKAALRAFYEGRYQAAAEALQGLAGVEGRTARTMFFLACSHSALAFLAGKEGGALLGRAHEEFAEAARLGPIDSLDKRWISPRIMRVFEEARRTVR